MKERTISIKHLALSGLMGLALIALLSWLMAGTAQAGPLASEADGRAPDSTNWCVAGEFNGWNNSNTPLFDDATSGDLIANDGVYSLDYVIPTAGRYEFKAVECGNWGNAYPSDNAWLITTEDNHTVKLLFDTNNYSANAGLVLRPAQNIVNVWFDTPPASYTVVGPWQGWGNANPATAMTAVGQGIYRLAYEFAAAGSYEAKIVQTGSWDNQIGADGRNKNAPTISFSTSAANETVIFLLDMVEGRMAIAPNGSGASDFWCAAGSFNGWNNASTPLYDDGANGDLVGGDGVYSRDVTIAAPGRYEFKAVTCGDWGTSYPSDNAWFITNMADQVVKITFDTNDHSGDAGLPLLPTQNIVNAWDDMPPSITAVGPWQGWSNDNPATTLASLPNNYYILPYQFDAGDYEAKFTNTGGWDNQIGNDGRNKNAPTIPFSVAADGDMVTFWIDGRNGRSAIITPEPVLPPIDLDLVRAPISHPVQDENFYFLLPDRFEDGDPNNNTGGIPGTHFDHGYLPTHKNFFHGGDLAGLTSRLDYLDDMGVTALWITPVFKNDVLEGSGTNVNTSYAGYHGYWILDFESIDPHLGTDPEFAAFVDAAHARGMKVYLDIVANHTGNMIQYLEGQYSYRNKTDYPYRDADGNIFDDRDYVGTGTFPALDPLVSFPYTPTFDEPAHETIKNPDWLNNPIYYHNRGDSTFSGESSTYGDFFGLDDLFTEHPDVVLGFIDIFTNTITNYNIDGFRIDTVKHVNIEFWQEVIPAVMDYATTTGNKPDFFMFGEVFDYHTPSLSVYTTKGGLPSVLDFQTQGYAYGFAIKSEPSQNLQTHFANDDYYTDADSNAYQLANFISNHDIGRFGGFIRNELGGAPNAEWLARSELGHALMFFARGFPIVYYGDEQGFVSDGGDADAREDMFPSQVASYNDNNLIGTDATTADSNFDNTHPLYQTFADYATVRSDHLALRRGAQIHRYGQNSAGIYAFSRIERDEKVEYVVALNNATTAANATFPVYSANMGFTAVYPIGSTSVITSSGGSQLTMNVPALSVAIYRANAPLAARSVSEAPDVTFYAPAEGSLVNGRVEVGVTLSAPIFAEVNFSVKIGDGEYEYLGTDNNAPYRIFYDVTGLPDGTPITFQAIVNDLNGNYKNNIVSAVVSAPSSADEDYVIVHYHRFNGDYGDFNSSDFNDFWGLHLWGNALHPDEYNAGWTEPRKFSGIDDYGAFVAMRLVDENEPVNFIVHKGDIKDPGEGNRFFDPSVSREIWLVQGDWTIYTSRAEALGETLVHYNRADEDYTGWGLHLWQDGDPPLTNWPDREMPSSYDDFGAVYSITTDIYPTLELTRGLNLIVHNGQGSQEPDRTYTPAENYEIWVNSGTADWYGQWGAATNTATIHYHRCLGDYGDFSSTNFNDFWGLHLWTGALTPTDWPQPLKPIGQDGFGLVFDIPLAENATVLNYILHRGDLKDVPEDQSLDLGSKGYEIWIVEGDGGANVLSAGVQFTNQAIAFNIAERVCAGTTIGNINRQRAYWLSEDTIGWSPMQAADTVYLHAAPTGGLTLDNSGITGGAVYTLTLNGTISGDIAAKFPHLAGLPAWEVDTTAVNVPELLTGQIAVSAFADGALVDATGLQIPGVLDDLYAASAYDQELGVVWDGNTPTFNLWAPTAKSVTLHRFANSNPATNSITYTMSLDPASGIWSYTGMNGWKGQYYLYEVEVYVHSTGQVERNIVSDPYSVSLAMNSARSQIFDLTDSDWQPAGWDSLTKPPLVGPQDISVYELHVRDFSAFDETVPENERGTFKAFTYTDTDGMSHLLSLADAGLTHLHLLPVFDIATINEDKSTWQEPDYAQMALYPPDSPEQQAAINAIRDQDAFNWGYDPLHYNAPEGSYSTNPDGPTRIIEFREMVQNLNENGLRVVVDVVYNHTNAAGQSEKSILDRVVPGYYHRLNANGQVENSTCCANTATEHDMMEKLMVDSVVLWAIQYKVDAFRFDLMGHHMKRNMLAVREALDALTIEEHGVDGSAIYLYGEGWNFGEVANDARGVNATQLNMAGTGIGTFSDRQRDAVRGGGPFDGGENLKLQGFANGLHYDPNALAQPDSLARLLLYSDQIRVGMAGNLAAYEFVDRFGNTVTGAQVDYNGQPAGYTAQPFEAITYISKHDNQTLYDINVYGMPATATMEERVRAQIVGLSTVALGQGVPFFHAGSEMLRSKSLDRDSYNSGDWFNRLDYTYAHNNFGVGLPIAEKNQENWPLMVPYLADPALVAGEDDITLTTALFEELLAIRASSPLFRLGDAELVQERLAYHNTGPSQLPGLIVMSLSDLVGDDLDPNHELVVVLINANDAAQTFTEAALIGLELDLHPVQQASVDPIVGTTTFNPATGAFVVPGRTTAVFILEQEQGPAPETIIYMPLIFKTAVPGATAVAPVSEPAALPETRALLDRFSR
jgi:pullulanase-type alpha-1,6-glucosidase